MSDSEKLSSRIYVNPQPSGKIRKSERTRAAILNAALDFLWTHLFREMTVNSLMAPTGAGRSAFYQYFNDLHEVMEILLSMLNEEAVVVTGPWFEGTGDPIVLLSESIAGAVDVCYRLGPILRATENAAATDERLEKVWVQFVKQFDDAVTLRIEAEQSQGLIPNLDARTMAIALNRLNIYSYIQAFGQRPRSKPEPVREALTRIWISTLYGSEFVGKESSNLLRT
jgi:AcrR family transcriptional regulator